MDARQTRRVLVGIIAAAGPMVLGFDLVARHFIWRSQTDDVRGYVDGVLTPLAWYAVPGPVIGMIAGFLFYPRIYARVLAQSDGKDPTADAQRADLRALFAAATMTQLPALAGDLSVMLGARLGPGITMAGCAVVGILLLATFAKPRSPTG